MENYVKFPNGPIPFEDAILILHSENNLRKLKDMPPIKEDSAIRDIEIYQDRKGNLSYILQDWGENRESIKSREPKFAEEIAEDYAI